MNYLFPEAELQRAHENYLREQEQAHPRVKTKAEILLEVVAEEEFQDVTVAELAEAAEHSESWVRRILKAAGVTLARQPVRRKEVSHD